MGYNSKKLIEGQQMITASFANVGQGKTFRVSDLKITGYQKDPMWLSNWGYGASFFVLDAYGRCLIENGRYFNYGDVLNDWDEETVESAVWQGGVWMDYAGAEVVPGGDNDTVLNSGDAIWFAGTAFTEGHQPVLETAGQVLGDDYQYPLIEGQNGVGNGMSAPTYLSDITVTGYQEDPMWLANWGYGASFFVLDAYGRCLIEKNRYFNYGDVLNDWDEETVESAVWQGGVWMDYAGAEVVAKGENDLILQPGDGIWFAAPAFTPDEEPVPGQPAKYQPYLVFPTAVK